MTNPTHGNPAGERDAAMTIPDQIDPTTADRTRHGAAPTRPSFPAHRPSRARLVASLSAGTVILLLGGTALYWQAAGTAGQIPIVSLSDTGASSGQWVTVEPQALTSNLDIAGTIAAGRSVPVVAPFDGVIREKRVQLGDHVDAGTVLVVMDTSEIANRYRDAQSAYLKAAMAAQALDKWDNGPDVLRSRRALEAAQGSLDTLERQVAALKALLDQGIISRNEYDGTVQQRDSQRNTVASARDDLTATLDRGSADNRQLVALDVENTQSRLRDLKAQMAGAEVATAVAGILTRPPVASNGQEPAAIEPGASVTRGTALFSIADISSFVVSGAVDEVDVNRVKVGQAVTIFSDAFPGKTLGGKIVSVSAEASANKTGGNAASFEVRASFKVDDDTLRNAIRIGMSSRMTVETYSNPAALIVPPSAIIDTGAGSQIQVMRDGKEQTVPVLLGVTFPQGVEIVSGLKAGDRVRMQP